MKEPIRPVFLERSTYRARRTTDAARLLPLTGAFLLLGLLPLVRTRSETGEPLGTSSGTVLFLFGVWVILIALAAYLSGPLGRIDRTDTKPAQEE
ncbi:hypothetical protein ACFE33_10490 [Falsihalocynthiibacter sp. SS001]|uniref:hypothetical protein n=1 Tax=Falsihalocynthiibacter sp. SS001 TaxID=3349698 RepID=UPI0036D3B788